VRQIRHPLSGAVYELDDDGHIVVTRNGAAGVFSGNGKWLHGEIRVADPELCRWIDSGNHPSPRLKASRRYIAQTSKATAGSDA
jgi:hypothetical protein